MDHTSLPRNLLQSSHQVCLKLGHYTLSRISMDKYVISYSPVRIGVKLINFQYELQKNIIDI